MNKIQIQRLLAIRTMSLLPMNERHQYDISNMGVGGFFQLHGKTYQVIGADTQQETNEERTKNKKYICTDLHIFCVDDGETHYLDWAIDDKLQIYFTQKKLKPSELARLLKYDDGEIVDIDDIDEIVEKKWELHFNGKAFYYDDSWPTLFNKTTHAYVYEFEADDGQYLTVEAFSESNGDDDDWDYEIYISKPVDSSDIEILQLGQEA